MIIPTDDPYRDFDRWEAEQEKWLQSRPVCEYCGEHIQDEHYYYIDKIVCEECLNENHKRYID